MITEVAAKAAEVISNAAHAVGEAAKAGIEHVQQTAECDVNELKVNRTIIAKPDFLYIKETTLQKLEAANASTLETIAEETHAAAEGLEESTSALGAEEGVNEIKGENPLTDVERFDANTGERIELHHMGQDYESPFAELCDISEHRGEGVDTILHDKNVESWRQDPEKKSHYCNVERPRHWRNRFEEAA